jgi:LPS sulfotransferase NodH
VSPPDTEAAADAPERARRRLARAAARLAAKVAAEAPVAPLYERVFGAPPPVPVGRLAWRELGVQRPYLVVATRHAGGAPLARLLARTRLCGRPAAFLEPHALREPPPGHPAIAFEPWFREVARRHALGGCFGLQISPISMASIGPYLDIPAAFPLATRPVFWVTRHDVLAQAYARIRLRAPGMPPLDDAALEREVLLLLSEEAAAEAWFRANGVVPHRLSYEEITADPPLVAARVMEALGHGTTEIAMNLRRLNAGGGGASEDARYLLFRRFLDRHGALAERVRRERSASDVAALREALAGLPGSAA